MRVELNPLAGWVWPTGLMFDTTVINTLNKTFSVLTHKTLELFSFCFLKGIIKSLLMSNMEGEWAENGPRVWSLKLLF